MGAGCFSCLTCPIATSYTIFSSTPLRPKSRRSFLGQRFRLTMVLSLAGLLTARAGLAQSNPQVSLETSETIFTVLTAINTCGYDQELNSSDPLRAQIGAEVDKAVETTPGAKEAVAPMCELDRKSTRLNSSHLGISY